MKPTDAFFLPAGSEKPYTPTTKPHSADEGSLSPRVDGNQPHLSEPEREGEDQSALSQTAIGPPTEVPPQHNPPSSTTSASGDRAQPVAPSSFDACSKCGMSKSSATGSYAMCRGRSGMVVTSHVFEPLLSIARQQLSPEVLAAHWRMRAGELEDALRHERLAATFNFRTINEQQRELNRLEKLLREFRSPEEIAALEAFDRVLAWLEHEAEECERAAVFDLAKLVADLPDDIETALLNALDSLVMTAHARFLARDHAPTTAPEDILQ